MNAPEGPEDLLADVVRIMELCSSTGDTITNNGLHRAALQLKEYRARLDDLTEARNSKARAPGLPFEAVPYRVELPRVWKREGDAYTLQGSCNPGGILLFAHVFFDARVGAWMSRAILHAIVVFEAEAKSLEGACRMAEDALHRAIEIRSPVRVQVRA